MLSPEMNHSVAPSGHNFAEAMLLRGHAPPGFPPSPFAAAATMDHQRVSLNLIQFKTILKRLDVKFVVKIHRYFMFNFENHYFTDLIDKNNLPFLCMQKIEISIEIFMFFL